MNCATTYVVEFDETLCDAAQLHADTLAETDTFSHATDLHEIGHGENLASFFSFPTGPEVDYSAPVQQWYDEISLYDFDAPGFTSGTGHFTQVIFSHTPVFFLYFGIILYKCTKIYLSKIPGGWVIYGP